MLCENTSPYAVNLGRDAIPDYGKHLIQSYRTLT
jgi:hypothetical protein